MDSEVYSLAIECLSTTGQTVKGVTRVVLVNERGQRVLDSLVRPVELPGEEKYVAKAGIKVQLLELAKARGPAIGDVTAAINYIIRDKKLVAYHLPLKMADLGMLG